MAGMHVALLALLFALPGWLPATAYRENDRVGYSLAQKESDEGVAGADMEAELMDSEALDDYDGEALDDSGEVDEGDKDDFDDSEVAREESMYVNQEDSSALSQVDSEEQDQGAMEDEMASSLGDTVSKEKEAVDHVEDSSKRVVISAMPPALLDKSGYRAEKDPGADALLKALEDSGKAVHDAGEKAKHLKIVAHKWLNENEKVRSAAFAVERATDGAENVLKSEHDVVQSNIEMPPAKALEALRKAHEKALQSTQEKGVLTHPDQVETKPQSTVTHSTDKVVHHPGTDTDTKPVDTHSSSSDQKDSSKDAKVKETAKKLVALT